MAQDLKYTFHFIETCNMCGSQTSAHQILGKRLNQSQGKNPKHKNNTASTVIAIILPLLFLFGVPFIIYLFSIFILLAFDN